MSELIHEINGGDFEAEVIQASAGKAVLVDFWAPWCGPCKMIAPLLEDLASELGTVKFTKLNTDENQETAQRYGVMSIPTLILFKDGKAVERIIGFTSKENLKKKITEHAVAA
ncbi:MAG: thioredoxin [bacterium]